MRILVSSIIDLERSAHNRLHEFISYLSREHEITVVSIRDWWKEAQTDVKRYGEGHFGMSHQINIHFICRKRLSPILQEFLSIPFLAGFHRGNGLNYDVHLNYNTLISGWYTASKLRRIGVPTIYDLADDLPAMIRTSPQIPPPLRILASYLAELMVRMNVAASEYVTITTPKINTVRDGRGELVVLPNGVDIKKFKKIPSGKFASELGLDGRFVVGYVGVLREWVDLEPVYWAIRELNSSGIPAEFLVVGEEGGLDRQRLLARNCGVTQYVHFTGTVSYADVPKYINCMHVGLVPFKVNDVTKSALPLKIFEYMACEVPVVCTRIEAIEEAIESEAIFFDDRNGLYSSIKNLFMEPSLRAEMGRRGRRLVQSRYSWDAIGEQLKQLMIICQGSGDTS